MNLFIAILTDFSHFIKIIMAMNLFGNFEERINKYKIILIATIIALASGIIYFDEKMKIGSIVYFVTTYAVFRIWYAEKRKLLLLFSIWIPFMMSMIDTMFLILVKLFPSVTSCSGPKWRPVCGRCRPTTASAWTVSWGPPVGAICWGDKDKVRAHSVSCVL